MIPSRSERGAAALDLFWDSFNSVHFYVEDEALENTYKAVLGRRFPSLKIGQIICLQGKPNVLRHARAPRDPNVTKPRVYLLDKDFDDVLGIKEDLPGVVYLDHYCLENYLLDEKSVIEMVVELKPRKKREDLRSALNYSAMRTSIFLGAAPLFRVFCVLQKHDERQEKKAGYSAARFTFEDLTQDAYIDPEKVAEYCELAGRRLVEIGAIGSVEELANHCAAAFSADQESANVSGKFALQVVIAALRAKKFIGNLDYDVAVYSLARNTDGEMLYGLLERIASVIREQGVQL